jgi:hypothetical protein
MIAFIVIFFVFFIAYRQARSVVRYGYQVGLRFTKMTKFPNLNACIVAGFYLETVVGVCYLIPVLPELILFEKVKNAQIMAWYQAIFIGWCVLNVFVILPCYFVRTLKHFVRWLLQKPLTITIQIWMYILHLKGMRLKFKST